MKKSHAFNELSDVRCGCGKRIKMRLVLLKTNEVRMCYKCYQLWRRATGKSYRIQKPGGRPVDHVPAAHHVGRSFGHMK